MVMPWAWTQSWWCQHSRTPCSTLVGPWSRAHCNEWWISPNPGGASQPGYWQCVSRAMMARVMWAGKMCSSRPTSRTVDSGPKMTQDRAESHARRASNAGGMGVPSGSVAGWIPVMTRGSIAVEITWASPGCQSPSHCLACAESSNGSSSERWGSRGPPGAVKVDSASNPKVAPAWCGVPSRRRGGTGEPVAPARGRSFSRDMVMVRWGRTRAWRCCSPESSDWRAIATSAAARRWAGVRSSSLALRPMWERSAVSTASPDTSSSHPARCHPSRVRDRLNSPLVVSSPQARSAASGSAAMAQVLTTLAKLVASSSCAFSTRNASPISVSASWARSRSVSSASRTSTATCSVLIRPSSSAARVRGRWSRRARAWRIWREAAPAVVSVCCRNQAPNVRCPCSPHRPLASIVDSTSERTAPRRRSICSSTPSASWTRWPLSSCQHVPVRPVTVLRTADSVSTGSAPIGGAPSFSLSPVAMALTSLDVLLVTASQHPLTSLRLGIPGAPFARHDAAPVTPRASPTAPRTPPRRRRRRRRWRSGRRWRTPGHLCRQPNAGRARWCWWGRRRGAGRSRSSRAPAFRADALERRELKGAERCPPEPGEVLPRGLRRQESATGLPRRRSRAERCSRSSRRRTSAGASRWLLGAEPALRQDGADELALAAGVGGAVVADGRRQVLLQPGVGPSGPGVGPERVAEAELIGLPHRPGLAHVHVDGARLTRGRPEEPVTRLARPQDEPQRLQGRPVGRLVVEPGDGDEEVEHRLGREPRDGGRPDVLQPDRGIRERLADPAQPVRRLLGPAWGRRDDDGGLTARVVEPLDVLSHLLILAPPGRYSQWHGRRARRRRARPRHPPVPSGLALP